VRPVRTTSAALSPARLGQAQGWREMVPSNRRATLEMRPTASAVTSTASAAGAVPGAGSRDLEGGAPGCPRANPLATLAPPSNRPAAPRRLLYARRHAEARWHATSAQLGASLATFAGTSPAAHEPKLTVGQVRACEAVGRCVGAARLDSPRRSTVREACASRRNSPRDLGGVRSERPPGRSPWFAPGVAAEPSGDAVDAARTVDRTRRSPDGALLRAGREPRLLGLCRRSAASRSSAA
jgi:hypothetical protein